MGRRRRPWVELVEQGWLSVVVMVEGLSQRRESGELRSRSPSLVLATP